MELIERIAIERECGRLPLLFARYADNGDHARCRPDSALALTR